MTASRRRIVRGAALLWGAAACHRGTPGAGAASAPGAEVRTAFAQALPVLDGARLRAIVLEVTYPPGGSSPPHSHPCVVVGYVLSGRLRTRVRGERTVVYHAGDTFYEPPAGVHQISANASRTEPVRFLAYFTCDRDAPLSADVALPGAGR